MKSTMKRMCNIAHHLTRRHHIPGFFLDVRKKTQGKKTQAWKKLKHIFKKTQGILQKHSIPPTQPRFFIENEKKYSWYSLKNSAI